MTEVMSRIRMPSSGRAAVTERPSPDITPHPDRGPPGSLRLDPRIGRDPLPLRDLLALVAAHRLPPARHDLDQLFVEEGPGLRHGHDLHEEVGEPAHHGFRHV